MLRSWGLAASRHASRSTEGISGSHSSSASVAPAPIEPGATPRGTIPRTSSSVSPVASPARRSGTSSVPPASNTVSLAISSTLDARRSSNLLLRGPALLGFAQCPEHLGASDRQLPHVGARRIADRVRDRGGRRDDRRLAEPLRAEVGQVRVRAVDQLADDLRDVGDRRQLVRVEAGVQDHAGRLGRAGAAPRVCGRRPG